MKAHSLTLLALAGCLTSSCIYYTDPVPDMPYRSVRMPAPMVVRDVHALNAARTEDAWHTYPPAAPHTPAGGMQPHQGYASVPAPEPPPISGRPGTNITQPINMAPPAVKPAPAAKPAPAPLPASKPAPTATRDPKTITNDGPIPVATPVPGDPTRVYNPLDSSKTIRILDRNGKVYPSGKELKVRGTNFHFYVP